MGDLKVQIRYEDGVELPRFNYPGEQFFSKREYYGYQRVAHVEIPCPDGRRIAYWQNGHPGMRIGCFSPGRNWCDLRAEELSMVEDALELRCCIEALLQR